MNEIRISSQCKINASQRQVWDIIANYRFINKIFGLNNVTNSNPRYSGSLSSQVCSAKRLFFTSRWIDFGIGWTRMHDYRLKRFYQRGAIKALAVNITLTQNNHPPSSCTVDFRCTLLPKNHLARFFVKQFAKKVERNFISLLRLKVHHANSMFSYPDTYQRPKNINYRALEKRLTKLKSRPINSVHADLLASLLRQGTDDEVIDIHPGHLATLWQQPLEEIIRLFFHAEVSGLLTHKLVAQCPYCLKPLVESSSLKDRPLDNYRCKACQTDHELNHSGIILVFAVHKDIRKPARRYRFIADPSDFFHIISQTVIAPTSSVMIETSLEAHDHILHALGSTTDVQLLSKESSSNSLQVSFSDNEWLPRKVEFCSNKPINLKVLNETSADLTCYLMDPRSVLLKPLFISDLAELGIDLPEASFPHET